MNKTIAILGIISAFVVGSIFTGTIAFADDDDDDDVVPAGQVACPAENVQHWNKILFQIALGAGDRSVVHPTLPTLVQTSRVHEIIIQVPTDRASTIQDLVADRLNELGYLRETSTPGQLFPLGPSNITYIDVEYSTICAEN